MPVPPRKTQSQPKLWDRIRHAWESCHPFIKIGAKVCTVIAVAISSFFSLQAWFQRQLYDQVERYNAPNASHDSAYRNFFANRFDECFRALDEAISLYKSQHRESSEAFETCLRDYIFYLANCDYPELHKERLSKVLEELRQIGANLTLDDKNNIAKLNLRTGDLERASSEYDLISRAAKTSQQIYTLAEAEYGLFLCAIARSDLGEAWKRFEKIVITNPDFFGVSFSYNPNNPEFRGYCHLYDGFNRAMIDFIAEARLYFAGVRDETSDASSTFDIFQPTYSLPPQPSIAEPDKNN